MNGFRRYILTPAAIPVAALAIVAIVVFNVSRILLYMEKQHSSSISTAVAIVIATAILVGCAFFATGRRRPTAGVPVLGVVAMALLFAGGYGAGAGHAVAEGGGGESASGAGGEAVFGATEFAFNPKELTLPAGVIKVTLRNDGRSHHTLLFENAPKFKKIVADPGVSASGEVQLAPGAYTFYCSELGHRGSGMEGTLTVTKGAP